MYGMRGMGGTGAGWQAGGLGMPGAAVGMPGTPAPPSMQAQPLLGTAEDPSYVGVPAPGGNPSIPNAVSDASQTEVISERNSVRRDYRYLPGAGPLEVTGGQVDAGIHDQYRMIGGHPGPQPGYAVYDQTNGMAGVAHIRGLAGTNGMDAGGMPSLADLTPGQKRALQIGGIALIVGAAYYFTRKK